MSAWTRVGHGHAPLPLTSPTPRGDMLPATRVHHWTCSRNPGPTTGHAPRKARAMGIMPLCPLVTARTGHVRMDSGRPMDMLPRPRQHHWTCSLDWDCILGHGSWNEVAALDMLPGLGLQHWTCPPQDPSDEHDAHMSIGRGQDWACPAAKAGVPRHEKRSGGRLPQGTDPRIDELLLAKSVIRLTSLSRGERVTVRGPR
jgi:hypothetical protein